MQNLEQEIKELIVSSLGLEDVTAEEIESNAPLFADGLGLDSIDALELGLAISKKYDVKLDPNSEEVHQHFATVSSLAKFVQQNKAA